MPHKKVKKEVELPSFLLELNVIPKDVSFPTKTTGSSHYLGPLFFGRSHQYHPPLHSVNFSNFRHVKKTYSAKENIGDLFLEKKEKIKKHFERPEVFKFVTKKKLHSDQYPHKAPGTRKAFVPEVGPALINLGETTSVIEGETTLEIPLYRLKKDPFSADETEFELVLLSDLKERKRMSMPYKERISHIHYPKQFANVTVIGPTIPAAITIKKLPSKRKTEIEMSLLINSKDRKFSKEEAEENKELQIVSGTEPKTVNSNEEQSIKTRSSGSNVENSEAGETQEEGGYQRIDNEVNKLEMEEGMTEIQKEESDEENEKIDTTAELLPVQEAEEEEKDAKNKYKIENVEEKGEEELNEKEPEN